MNLFDYELQDKQEYLDYSYEEFLEDIYVNKLPQLNNVLVAMESGSNALSYLEARSPSMESRDVEYSTEVLSTVSMMVGEFKEYNDLSTLSESLEEKDSLVTRIKNAIIALYKKAKKFIKGIIDKVVNFFTKGKGKETEDEYKKNESSGKVKDVDDISKSKPEEREEVIKEKARRQPKPKEKFKDVDEEPVEMTDEEVLAKLNKILNDIYRIIFPYVTKKEKLFTPEPYVLINEALADGFLKAYHNSKGWEAMLEAVALVDPKVKNHGGLFFISYRGYMWVDKKDFSAINNSDEDEEFTSDDNRDFVKLLSKVSKTNRASIDVQWKLDDVFSSGVSLYFGDSILTSNRLVDIEKLNSKFTNKGRDKDFYGEFIKHGRVVDDVNLPSGITLSELVSATRITVDSIRESVSILKHNFTIMNKINEAAHLLFDPTKL